MDTARDIAENEADRKYGKIEDESLFCEERNGVRSYYRNIWDKILDEHFAECPTAVSARRQVKSTLCYCSQIEEANTAAQKEILAAVNAEECLRCHNLVADCKCGAKAQLV